MVGFMVKIMSDNTRLIWEFLKTHQVAEMSEIATKLNIEPRSFWVCTNTLLRAGWINRKKLYDSEGEHIYIEISKYGKEVIINEMS